MYEQIKKKKKNIFAGILQDKDQIQVNKEAKGNKSCTLPIFPYNFAFNRFQKIIPSTGFTKSVRSAV